ncbi:hypothetical protein CHGG_00423 [Chaetomium globosum CBS 148.51]|uniref:Uncharacterized protein n=1 Tax=Chaetomium globosum (strain ATCC 6205 / CBS 148.51 / DSM 1962 / NBRC 6347 / NRRL 1970) TaxID=306901 RepID=Q2HH81_CHAGB|nr:uncharacterized protein CHGG_00423 [Chaetomium globosum CBS 148.51]EAQ92188.1 hypothetical protein CHGG_00423 [Chaetomium globosum CBS 148.51]
MAHLPPNAAIFSPSVARAAASAAKDWSYVDGWLQRKFPGVGPPTFERNADTLRVLLALAAANEAADEERTLVARLEAETLTQLRAREQPQSQAGGESTNTDNNTLDSAREAILTALETSLPREGQTALTALAALALQTNTPLPTPAALGTELITLSSTTATLEQTTARIHTLTTHLAREAAATAQLAAELRPPSPPHHPHPHDNVVDDDDDDDENNNTTNNPSPHQATSHKPPLTGYHPPADLALQNLTLQRQIKALSTRIPELRDKAAAIARSTGTGTTTTGTTTTTTSIADVRREEEAYTALLAAKRELDGQVRAFAGLPPDAERARQELEGLRGELRRMTLRRDEVFEGLVERETPRKRERGASVRK